MKLKYLPLLLINLALSHPLVLWYDSDAGDSFTDALPLGNGVMGIIILTMSFTGLLPSCIYPLKTLNTKRNLREIIKPTPWAGTA